MPIMDSIKLASLFLPLQGRVASLYGALGSHNTLCAERLYMNLGYWKNGAQTLDQASENLVDLVCQWAEVEAGAIVLDAGCGFADQDRLMVERYGAAKVHALNISEVQLEEARRRVSEWGLDQKIELHHRDACEIPLPRESVDAVVAIESAFHFDRREDFFAEAFRVLRPGGRIVLADLCAVKEPAILRDRLANFLGQNFWQIPASNRYGIETYASKMKEAGFSQVVTESIWRWVHPPFAEFARKVLADEAIQRRLNPFYRSFLNLSLKARPRLSPKSMDYIIACGEKPWS